MMTKVPDGRYAVEIAPGCRIALWQPGSRWKSAHLCC
jgi:hypothetical protein